MWLFKCHLFDLTWSAGISCSNMHDNAIIRFFGFFWSFFIYNLFHFELRLIYYEFLKFWTFSEFYKSFLIYFKFSECNYCISLTSGWCQQVNRGGSRPNLTSGSHWSGFDLVSHSWPADVMMSSCRRSNIFWNLK